MLSTCLHLITTLRHRERCWLHHLFKAACKPLQGCSFSFNAVFYFAECTRGDAAHMGWGQQAPATPLL